MGEVKSGVAVKVGAQLRGWLGVSEKGKVRVQLRKGCSKGVGRSTGKGKSGGQ